MQLASVSKLLTCSVDERHLKRILRKYVDYSPSLLHSTRCLSRPARNGCRTSHQLTPLPLSRAGAGS